MNFQSDFLVIGSGIAGLRFSLYAAQIGTVYIITKKDKAESNTNYAQGGIASVFSKDDTFDSHINDTLIAGAGLCNYKAVEFLVKHGPEEINKLLNLGVDFSKTEKGELDLGREGGHSHNRIIHAKDLTGKEVEQLLLKRVAENKNIHIFEDYFAIDLITEHNIPNLKNNVIENRHCYGAYVYDILGKVIHKFTSKFTILATGGLGQGYLYTTNPLIATGDGFAMAFRAGARLSNMEFIQFHPTSLWEPRSGDTIKRVSFLISEAVRGKGAKLRLRDGTEFMKFYDNRGELAPRDIVARAIDNELKKSGEEYVFLDITHLNKNILIDYFPNIYNYCLKLNIDISKDWIPVVPAAHYACGGVDVDLNGRTTIDKLYAIGEVSMTGVHGANRLASNSLLEALVFSYSAFIDCQSRINEIKSYMLPELPDWDSSGTTSPDEKILISQSRMEIKQILWDYVGIVRSNKRLERAKVRIKLILNEIDEMYKKLEITEELLEIRNLSCIAKLIVESAFQRYESRGLHYNIDYPNIDDKNFLKNTIIQNFSI